MGDSLLELECCNHTREPRDKPDHLPRPKGNPRCLSRAAPRIAVVLLEPPWRVRG